MGKRLVMMMSFVGRGLVFLDGNSVLFPRTNPAGREIFVPARTYLAVKQKCLTYSHVVGSVSQLPTLPLWTTPRGEPNPSQAKNSYTGPLLIPAPPRIL
jgi:hypothetical protein